MIPAHKTYWEVNARFIEFVLKQVDRRTCKMSCGSSSKSIENSEVWKLI